MVLPGDEIQVECFFDTTDRDEFTFWGRQQLLVHHALPCYKSAGAKTTHSDFCLQPTNAAQSTLQQLTYTSTTSYSLHLFPGDATSAEMCIAITQYYPKQATADDCWGSEYEHANIGSCEEITVCVRSCKAVCEPCTVIA